MQSMVLKSVLAQPIKKLYVHESRSLVRAQVPLIIHSTYMYAPIGINYKYE